MDPEQSGSVSGQLAELFFLSREPLLVRLLWKLAAIPTKDQKTLDAFLRDVGDPGQLQVTVQDNERICLHMVKRRVDKGNLSRRSRSSAPK